VDRPRREIAALRTELKLIEKRRVEGRALADDWSRASFIHKKLLRWEWQENEERE